MSDALTALAIAANWALYIGSLGASGTVFCAAVFGIAGTRKLAAMFAFVALVAASVSFSLKGAALTGDVAGMWDGEMLSLLWQTSSGTMIKLQLAGLALLFAGLVMGDAGRFVCVIGGFMVLLAFAMIGHVADRGNWLVAAVLVLHLGAAAFWFGILFPLYRLAGDPNRLSDAAALGARFGQSAIVAVPVLLLAGVVMAYVLLGSFPAITGTAYGRVLLVKIVVVGILLILGAANKLRFVPSMQRKEPGGAVRLRRSIAIEWVCFVAVTGCTAILTATLSPPL